MNSKELNSFRLSDAVTFHDELNPKLFRGQKLQPNIDKQLTEIAEDFLSELGVSGLTVTDITISGSNAAYSYTEHSDLDLHILVDMSKLPNDEVYRELFDAKKTIYNDNHDIFLNKIPVELYIQDSNQPVISVGEYSVLHNKWIKIPSKRRANFDQNATSAKYEKLEKLIHLALKSNDLQRILTVLKTIHRYRQAGLDKGGEFGPENLAYKALRSKGLITELYALRNKLHSKRLSIEGQYAAESIVTKSQKLFVKRLVSNEEVINYVKTSLIPEMRAYGVEVNPHTIYPALSSSIFEGVSKVIDSGKDLLSVFERVDQFKNMNISVGSMVSLLMVSMSQEFVEFFGFRTPKKITKIYREPSDNSIIQFEFNNDPDDVWPKQPLASYNGKVIMSSAFFPSAAAMDQSLLTLTLAAGEDLTITQHITEGASGYIPSNAEKNDPRFVKALSVDVNPYTMQKNAKKFGWNISRAGIPPLLRK